MNNYLPNNDRNKVVVIAHRFYMMPDDLLVDEHDIEFWSHEMLPEYLAPVCIVIGACYKCSFVAAAVLDKSTQQYIALCGEGIIGDKDDFEKWALLRLETSQ